VTAAAGDQAGGILFDIQRWSTQDGPGIRTTLFFKGCPLRCPWCCNPESWSPRPQLGWFQERCRGCGVCSRGCDAVRDPSRPCTACGACVEACPHGARQLLGRYWSAEEILAEVARDQAFHRRSGGGVTFSGGEAACQPRLLGALTERLARTGTHLVLETCGHFAWNENEAALARMDLVYFDLKHLDSAAHERLTGVGNGLILDNAARLAATGIPMVVRMPLIPGHNDSAGNLKATARFVLGRLGASVPIEVMPYHRLGAAKGQAIGEPSTLGGILPPTAEALASARSTLEAEGVRVVS